MVKITFQKQIGTTPNYQFVFEEDIDAYVEALAASEVCYVILFCNIFTHTGQKVAVYCKKWEKKVGNAAIQNFINRFMVDTEFRKSYFKEGKEIGEVNASYASVHPDCKLQIQYLNENEGRLSYRDFSELRTYGKDAISAISAAEVKKMIPERILTFLQEHVKEEDDRVKAMRWMLRGLSVKNALRKIEVDRQIAERKKIK